ncbi:dihydropteroate synthase [Marinicella litoralis]|uniref:dihydropteroate synthase n=1 Tax=Marinicella litoralis TaxID=644220 RepID=A0A4R6XW40_9GAMM|nr:dihydropteroate synthase [Marinicella litoralis]TDR22650.1 dihydropteroate synthase [Marinicella litoralis]
MGVLNVTPDSFSDGGQFSQVNAAMQQVDSMVMAQVDWIDVGGESTRPGADTVSVDEEISRVVPIIKAIKAKYPEQKISIDSSKPEVMEAAIMAGATMINDVNALQADEAIEIAVVHDVMVCLMHKQGTPQNMQDGPEYDDVVQQVLDFFDERVEACLSYGMDADRIILDPGIGFGKTLHHNLQLLRNTSTLKQMGLPVMIGVSRKSMFQDLLQRPVDQRLAGSLAVAQFTYLQGADYFRVHDVAETMDVLKTCQALIADTA